jgi:hypothetical protein
MKEERKEGGGGGGGGEGARSGKQKEGRKENRRLMKGECKEKRTEGRMREIANIDVDMDIDIYRYIDT